MSNRDAPLWVSNGKGGRLLVGDIVYAWVWPCSGGMWGWQTHRQVKGAAKSLLAAQRAVRRAFKTLRETTP